MKHGSHALYWALGIVGLTCVPYLAGWIITPPGGHFTGLTHNIDDAAVYLSWIRQAATGHFFATNLYTNEPQPAAAFNVFFLLMGLFGRVTGLSGIWVYHIFRVALGLGFLLWVPRIARLYLDEDARKYALPLIGLSAGIGWMMPGAQMPTGSVDAWQPEAVTFLSIYLNPLFVAGLWLMCATICFLTLAERTGHLRYALLAGLTLLVLGNVHTYDVLPVSATWIAYLLVTSALHKRVNWRLVGMSTMAALAVVPSLAYQMHVYAIDPIYRARANTPTPSAPIWSVLSGYGFLVVLAVLTAVVLLHPRLRTRLSFSTESAKALLVPGVWAVVNLLTPYLPVAQQRKLLMGAHIPICILACVAATLLIRLIPEPRRPLAYIAGLLLLSLSNIGFLANDTALLTQNQTVTVFAPYIAEDTIEVCDYIASKTGTDDSVFADPQMSLWLPPIAGTRVYYGHWSETPDYGRRLRQWFTYTDSSTEQPERESILRESRCSTFVGMRDDLERDAESTGDRKPHIIGSYAVFRIQPPEP